MKRIVSFVLAVLLLLPLGLTAEENAAMIINGDFSETSDDGTPKGWNVQMGSWGENISLREENGVHGGAVRMWGEDENCILSQDVQSIKGGAEYTLSLSAKRIYGEGASYRLEFYEEKDGVALYLDKYTIENAVQGTLEGEWEEESFVFTPPSSATMLRVMLCLYGSGEYLFDDVVLTGGDKAGDAAVSEGNDTDWEPIVLDSAENILPNGDMEEAEGGFAKGYKAFAAKDGTQEVFLNTDRQFAHSGNNSIYIHSVQSNMPWASINFVDMEGKTIVPGGEYELSFWMYTPSAVSRAGYKIEGYNVDTYGDIVNGTCQDGGGVIVEQKKEEGWKYYAYKIVLPEYTESVTCYLRVYGQGEAYYDDLSLKLIRGPEAITRFLTDDVFYYNDMEGTGTATALANTVIYPEFIGAKCRFSLRDKSLELFSETVEMSADGRAEFRYPLSYFTGDWKPYNIYMEFISKDGKLITTRMQEIHKCPRPNYMTKEGYYSEDGGKTIFEPMVMYHLSLNSDAEFAAAEKAGVNVVQGYPVDAFLEKCLAHNMKAFVVLYEGGAGGISAGAPDRIERTKETVKKYMNHPAVFAWALMDEPPASRAPELKVAYEEIRKIDPNHPVFITANGEYDVIGNYTDIVSCDMYPYGLSPFTTTEYKNIEKNITIIENEKPIYNLLQMFDIRQSYPTAHEIRNMIYQSFWAGAAAYGGYAWEGSTHDPETGAEIPLQNTHLYEPLVSFYNLEKRDVLDHFVYKKYPTFSEVREEGAWYRSWVKGNALQMVVLSKDDKKDVPVDIRLTSGDGSITIADFTAKVINGAEKETLKSHNGTLSLVLEPGQTILFEITPLEAVDLSGIESSAFVDMYDHGWAQSAVKELHESGALYTNGHTFRPQEAVTRADFVYMLSRVMGLSSDATESFADVDFRDYYAGEIAAAKSEGIIKGIDETRFGTENTITRQDVMTICARALQKAGKTTGIENVPTFSDMDAVSDYAKDAVCLMAGMGVVEGKGDGTVAPLETTTRAEAAVIISRIKGLL